MLLSKKSEAYSIIVGLNPALQKRLILSDKTPNLTPGNVHRASAVQEGIGGKGQDVAVTLACLSSKGHNLLCLAQLIGEGPEGDLAMSKLKEALQDNTCRWASLSVRSSAKLRTCTTIVAHNSATELVEPSGVISLDEIKLLMDKIDIVCADADGAVGISGLCIMGSMPPGCPKDLYANIYTKFTTFNPRALCILDTVVGLEYLFQQMKAAGNITSNGCGRRMLKINLSELYRLAGKDVTSEASMASLNEIKDALADFYGSFPDASDALDYIALTNGCHPAHLVLCNRSCDTKEVDSGISDSRMPLPQIFRIPVPDLSMVKQEEHSKIYPIGAGDSVAAGTLAAWECLERASSDPDGTSAERLDDSIQNALKKKYRDCGNEDSALVSFAFGIACGSASCVQEDNSVLSISDTLCLFESIEIEFLS